MYPIEGGDGEKGEEKDVGPPAVKRSEKVDVKWGNLVFFEVQPGKRWVVSLFSPVRGKYGRD